MEYLSSADLMPPLQSGYRQAILLKLLYSGCSQTFLQAVDNGDLAALVLLDLSAAFDTVDHSILLRCLHQTFGIMQRYRSQVVSLVPVLQEAVCTPRP